MYYVITAQNGHDIIEKGSTKTESVHGSKIYATNHMEQMGYFPCDNSSFEKGKWFRGIDNPYWALRRTYRRYFVNKNRNIRCIFIVPTHRGYALEDI